MVFTDPSYNVPIDGHVGGSGKIGHREFAMASEKISRSQITTNCGQATQVVYVILREII